MAPGLVPNPCFQTLVDESRAVTGGIDRLLYGSNRLTDPVSIRFGRSLPLIDESKGEGGSSIDAKEVPVVTVSDSSGNIRKNMGTVLSKDGAAYYIGVVADPSVGPPESPEVSTLSVKGIDGEYHLYDVREKSYRSGMKATSFQAAPGDAFLFAMLPYRVREITLKTDATVLSPGNSFSCQATVVTQDGRVPGRHVLSLEVLGPDGVPRSWLSDVLEARDGSAKITIPVSTGDTPGKWVVRVRDIASGKQSERVFIVMPPTGG